MVDVVVELLLPFVVDLFFLFLSSFQQVKFVRSLGLQGIKMSPRVLYLYACVEGEKGGRGKVFRTSFKF